MQKMGKSVSDNNNGPVVFDDNLDFSSGNKMDSKYMYENS